MRDEFLVFGRPIISDDEIAEVVDSLKSGWIGTGPKVRRFEAMLEKYLEVENVRCVSSCTSALFLALKCLGIGPGDEVLLPTFTFVATANVVEHVGAKPVFVDSEPETGLIDLSQAESLITARTKAIVPVHLYGRPVDMDRLNALRDRFGIQVIEDAAHAIGAEWRGRRVGSFGNLTAFSFYPTKNITTIEGGALATTDSELASRVEQLALHGLSAGAWQRFSDQGFKHYMATEVGYKFNMTDVQAALGLHQLPKLDTWIAEREQIARTYDQALHDLPVTTPAAADPDTRHAQHLYPVLINDDAPAGRDAVLDSLTRSRIGAGVHYTAVHLHPFYGRRYSLRAEAFPVATDLSRRTLSLPFSPALTQRDMFDVVESLSKALHTR